VGSTPIDFAFSVHTEVEFDSALKLRRDIQDRELKKARRTLPNDPHTLLGVAVALGQSDFPHTVAALEKLAQRLQISGRGVRIQGMDNLMVRYSRCCQPVPGDAVVGYITRGRGISIHRQDCPNVLHLSRDPERRVDIEWAAEKGDRFMVRLFVEGTDRRGLLSDVAKAIADTGTDIQHADMRTSEGGMHGEFVVEVQDLAHLEKVRRAILDSNVVLGGSRP
jgi:(p)ppGpp synthase/HD superfamily hydrolase